MKAVLRPVSHRYRRWMDRWETDLCFRATDRVVRPFELGLDWSADWLPGHGPVHSVEELIAMNQTVISRSEEFFAYDTPRDFRLSEDWLTFTSPVATPYPENNKVHARWFSAKSNGRKAVVLLHIGMPSCLSTTLSAVAFNVLEYRRFV